MNSDFTVLAIDDDFRIAGLHASIVESAPRLASIGTVGTVRGALSLIERDRPDLVLLDAYLPDGSGLDLIRRIDCDVIMVTAANESATVARALRHGAFSYLIKPFEPSVLFERLAAYVGYRDAFSRPGALDQGAVDAALSAARGSAPSGSRSRGTTEQLVLDSLITSPAPLSAPEVAELVGVSRATAQRYLGSLAAARLVDIQLKYGSTGRPEHRYVAL